MRCDGGADWSAFRFEGDLTIALSSGLRVRIPYSQFVKPHVGLNRRGGRRVDEERLDVVINGVGNEPTTLGRYFLTSACLMVNHDAKVFTLWQANPTTSTNLVPVFDKETEKRCGNANGIMQYPMAKTSASSKPSGAVVGGAVAGGAIAAALLGLGAFAMMRRRRESAGGEPASPGGDGAVSDQKTGQFSSVGDEGWAQEMPGSSHVAAPEMHGNSHHVYEMDGTGSLSGHPR